MSSLHESYIKAEAYAHRGWIPLPAFASQKRPALSAWQTVTLESWRDVWDAAPAGADGLALLCGMRSGLLVVDFDEPDVREAFDAALPHLTDTYQVTTPSGGRHYYYTASGLSAQMLNIPGRLIAGVIEARWNGQIVIAPPSAGYTVTADRDPLRLDVDSVALMLRFIQSVRMSREQPETQQTKSSDNGFQVPGKAELKRRKEEEIDRFFTREEPETETIKEEQVPVVRDGMYLNELSRFGDWTDQQQRQYLLATWRRELVLRAGRNEALLYTAIWARDKGAVIDDLYMIQDAFVQAPAPPRHRRQSEASRCVEFTATVRSAFSRPARPAQGWKRPEGLNDGLREAMLQDTDISYGVRRGPALLAVWESLVVHGDFQPGMFITRSEALQAACCGRRRVHAALDMMNVVFEASSPSPHLSPSGATRCTASGDCNQQKLRFSRCETCEKTPDETNIGGRPAHFYRIPDVDALESAYKDWSEVSDVDNKWSTPLSEEELKTTKGTRQALYRSFVERKPGNWSNKWLGKVYGCHEDTIKNDDAALGITSEPDYDRLPVFWSNLNEIPTTDDHQTTGFTEYKAYGWFLVDLQAQKRYPALKPIAVKLLKKKRWIVLYRQKTNLKYIGQKPVRTFDAIKAQTQQQELPGMPSEQPEAVSTWRKEATETGAAAPQSDSQVEQKPQKQTQSVTKRRSDNPPTWEEKEADHTSDIFERLKTIINMDDKSRRYKRWRCTLIINGNYKNETDRAHILDWVKGQISLYSKRKRAQRAIDKAAQTEAQKLAESIKERVNSLNPKQPKLHMSSSTALKLVEQYGYKECERQINHMMSRDGIRNPVGWLYVVLRSNKKARDAQETYR